MSKIEISLQQFPGRFSKWTRITEESFASEVYLVESATERHILKCAHSEIKYWRELRSLEFLKDSVLVPTVLESLDPAEKFSGALLMNQLLGHPLKAENIDISLARACGQLLAKLHLVPVEVFGYFQKEGFEKIPFENWWAYRRDMIFGAWTTPIQDKVDAVLLKRIHNAFSKRFDEMSDNSLCYIHCDFRLGNILANEGQITGLIDFESARTGDPAYDFIKIHESIYSRQNLWNAFLEGYSELRPLPDLEKTIPYYELDLNFGFLQWATLRGDDKLFQTRLSQLISLLDKQPS